MLRSQVNSSDWRINAGFRFDRHGARRHRPLYTAAPPPPVARPGRCGVGSHPLTLWPLPRHALLVMLSFRLTRLAATLGRPAASCRSATLPSLPPPPLLAAFRPPRAPGRPLSTVAALGGPLSTVAALGHVSGWKPPSLSLALQAPPRSSWTSFGGLQRRALAPPLGGTRPLSGTPSGVGAKAASNAADTDGNKDINVDDAGVDLSTPPILAEADLVEKFVRGSGSGGQKINKTSSCVQLTHTPTGLSVSVQASRSQSRNRVLARRALAAKLDDAVRGAASAAATEAAAARARKARRRRKCIKKHFKSRGDRAAMDF